MADSGDLVSYVNELREKVKARKLHFFWVMPARNDFKPLIHTETEMCQRISDSLSKYAGKQIANIVCRVAPNPQSAINDGKYLLRFSVTVSTIMENGEMEKTNNASMVTVNYYAEDLEERKFAFKDMERFAKLCANGKISSSALGGKSFTEHMEFLKKKRISYDDLYVR